MMNGILILAHGSKRQETEEILNSLIEKVKAKTGEKHVYPAFLQFSEQNLERSIDLLVGKGVSCIRIIPMFLFNGVHVTEDIPNELKEINKKYPEIKIMMSKHIGDDDKLADIIVERINSLD